VLFAILAEDAPEDLLAAFEALPKSALSKVLAGARQVLELLAAGPHERAADLLAEVLDEHR
jgi:hypothetical protein